MQTDPFIDSVSLSDYYYNQVRAGLSHILLYCIYLIMYILYYAMLYRHMKVHNIHVIYILNYTNKNQLRKQQKFLSTMLQSFNPDIMKITPIKMHLK